MRKPLVLLMLLALTAAACGAAASAPPSPAPASIAASPSASVAASPSEDASSPSADASPEPSVDASPSEPTASGSGSALVMVADSELGEILVDAEGRTLYGFTPDTAGESTCYDGCAANWPPLLAEGEFEVGEGLDDGDFSTTERTDGTMQVKIGDRPLYYFAGDTEPGQTNGQGVGDVWYVVGPDGELIE